MRGVSWLESWRKAAWAMANGTRARASTRARQALGAVGVGAVQGGLAAQAAGQLGLAAGEPAQHREIEALVGLHGVELVALEHARRVVEVLAQEEGRRVGFLDGGADLAQHLVAQLVRTPQRPSMLATSRRQPSMA